MSREVESERPETTAAEATPDSADPETAAAAQAAAEDAETGADGEHPDGPTELEKALAEAAENRDRYLRTAAELDNFRKRTVKIRAETREETLRDMLLQVAPLLDNFRRALGQESGDLEALRTGIEILYEQFSDILTGYGLQEIESEGQPFDPNLHEAMMQMPSAEHAPGTVVQEMERGYKLNDRVVRPARVVVSTAPADSTADEASQNEGEA